MVVLAADGAQEAALAPAEGQGGDGPGSLRVPQSHLLLASHRRPHAHERGQAALARRHGRAVGVHGHSRDVICARQNDASVWS